VTIVGGAAISEGGVNISAAQCPQAGSRHRQKGRVFMEQVSSQVNAKSTVLCLAALLALWVSGCSRQPSPDELLQSAGQKVEKGDLNGALADINKALEVGGPNPNAYFNRAIVHRQMGDYLTAEADLTSVLLLKPKDVEARLYRARLRYELGNYDGAIQDNSDVLKINPGSEDAHYGRATSAYQAGRFSDAIKDFEWVTQNGKNQEMIKESQRLIDLAKKDK
jgi:tetratricopeptide (TPR) repeat protein